MARLVDRTVAVQHWTHASMATQKVLMVQSVTNHAPLITFDMLQHLPEPVKRYMAYTGVVGKPRINTVRVKQVGKFRLGPRSPWLGLVAEQFFTTNPPGFIWNARFKLAGLPLMSVQDSYTAGHGHMFGKIAGLLTVVDARGEELDQGSMLRYLGEMTWFPTAFLGENITWHPIDNFSAEVTFTDCGKSVSACMTFDAEGHPTSLAAERYREIKGKYSLDRWTTQGTVFGVRGGLNMHTHGRAAWNLPSGDLPYIDIDLREIEYNQPIEAF